MLSSALTELTCVQNLFVLFLVILGCSKLGALKLGHPDDVPDFPTASWFMMVCTRSISSAPSSAACCNHSAQGRPFAAVSVHSYHCAQLQAPTNRLQSNVNLHVPQLHINMHRAAEYQPVDASGHHTIFCRTASVVGLPADVLSRNRNRPLLLWCC